MTSTEWWRDAETLRREIDRAGSFKAAAKAHQVSDNNLRKWWAKHGLPPRERPIRNQHGERLTDPGYKTTTVGVGDPDDQWLLDTLRRLGDHATAEQIADHADVSPRRVREAAERLGLAGFRVSETDGRVRIDRVPPQRENLHTALFDGNILRVGVVSDTHLGANEEALDELHLAYDIFHREGISEVWHAGDWGTGVGMFKTHHVEAHVHTGPAQADYLVEHYPRRPGIRTRGISGNHDIEGDFGRIGFDPVAALAAKRDDVDYLGAYDAWLELREGTGSWVNLRHGSGGMSYAYSYKAQKMVDGYPAGRKPAVLIVGHWHVRGNFMARNVEVVFPGCFEWQSRFMARLGLQPAVGFHILEMTVGDDGSVVRFNPQWFPFFSGRRVAA